MSRQSMPNALLALRARWSTAQRTTTPRAHCRRAITQFAGVVGALVGSGFVGLVAHASDCPDPSETTRASTEPACQVRFYTQGRIIHGAPEPPTEIKFERLDAQLTPLEAGAASTSRHTRQGFVFYPDALAEPALLTATTAVKHPLSGAPTRETLTLQALTAVGRVNHIHALTTLEVPRVEALYDDGLSLTGAKSQALNEWANVLGVNFASDNASAIDLAGPDGDALLALMATVSTTPAAEPRPVAAQQALIEAWGQNVANAGALADAQRATLAQSAQAARSKINALAEHAAAASDDPTPSADELDTALQTLVEANTHRITIEVTGSGVTTPANTVQVLPGESQTIELAPATGQQPATVQGTCPGSLSGDGTRYTTTPSQDCTLEVVFAPKVYSIDVAMNEPGSTEPVGPIEIEHGESVSLQITFPSGFDGLSVSGCGGALVDQTYTVNNVVSDCAVEIDFFERFFVADNGWTIRCPRVALGEVGVVNGVTYTKRDRTMITPDNATTSCISGETDLSGLFQNAAGFNGDIHHWDTQAVVNMDRMFQGAAAFNQDLSQWCVAQILASPADFDSGASQWSAAKARPQWGTDCTLLTQSVVVSASAGSGGQLTPEGQVIRRYGQRLAFSVTPESGFVITDVTGCGGALSGTTYLTDTLTSDCAVLAEFSAFYRKANGVTIACPGASVGEVGVVDGVSYTKRDKAGITPANAATSCITGVTNLDAVFKNADTFNGDITHWDVSAVTTMVELFSGASVFNQDIGAWETGEVTNVDFMFLNAKTFNQDLSGWCLENVEGPTFSFSSGADAWSEAHKPSIGQPCPP